MSQGLDTAAVTRTDKGIHNPEDLRHFMRLKPVPKRLRILLKGEVIVDSTRAVRCLEAGNDLYDPVYYVPREDVKGELVQVEGKRTWCPLKGHADYYGIKDKAAEIAWSYNDTLSFSDELKGLIGFNAAELTFEESPLA